MWLDPDKTSPYQFRQFWVQTDDEQVERYLRQLSLRPLGEIEALIEAACARRRSAGWPSGRWPTS